MDVEKLKKYAKNLEFDMKEEEYKTLLNEFEILFKQMDLMANIDGIENYEPLDFPFELEESYLREDIVEESLDKKIAFQNSNFVESDCIKTPKVVD